MFHLSVHHLVQRVRVESQPRHQGSLEASTMMLAICHSPVLTHRAVCASMLLTGKTTKAESWTGKSVLGSTSSTTACNWSVTTPPPRLPTGSCVILGTLTGVSKATSSWLWATTLAVLPTSPLTSWFRSLHLAFVIVGSKLVSTELAAVFFIAPFVHQR